MTYLCTNVIVDDLFRRNFSIYKYDKSHIITDTFSVTMKYQKYENRYLINVEYLIKSVELAIVLDLLEDKTEKIDDTLFSSTDGNLLTEIRNEVVILPFDCIN